MIVLRQARLRFCLHSMALLLDAVTWTFPPSKPYDQEEHA